MVFLIPVSNGINSKSSGALEIAGFLYCPIGFSESNIISFFGISKVLQIMFAISKIECSLGFIAIKDSSLFQLSNDHKINFDKLREEYAIPKNAVKEEARMHKMNAFFFCKGSN